MSDVPPSRPGRLPSQSQPLTVFLAAPFDPWMKADRSSLLDERKAELQLLIELVESFGHQVISSHRREEFGAAWMEPDECTPLDYEAIRKCDLIIALPGRPFSGGVHIEIGWASAFGKKIILLLEGHEPYSSLVEGLPRIANVTKIRYRFAEEYRQVLGTEIHLGLGDES